MNRKYSKKQIQEAISYWKKLLNEAGMTDLLSLVDAMKAGEASFSYRKKDGSIRRARGTLVGHGNPPFFRRGYVNYYDLDADGWRMFGRDLLVDGDLAQAAAAQYTPLDTAPAGEPKSLADALLKRSKISREINSESDSQEKRINAIRRKYVFTSDVYSRSTIKRWEWKYGATNAASDNAEYDRMQKEVDNDNVLHAIGARISKLEAEYAKVNAEITSIVLKSVLPKEDYSFYRYSYFLTIVDGAGYLKVLFKKKNTWDTEEFLLRSDGALPSFWQPGMDIDSTWNDFVLKVKAAGGKVLRIAKSEDFLSWCSKLLR